MRKNTALKRACDILHISFPFYSIFDKFIFFGKKLKFFRILRFYEFHR